MKASLQSSLDTAGDEAAGDDAAQGIAEALSRRVALGSWTAPPSRSELRWRVCGRRQGGVRGVVGLATCWLHPQAIYGLPPVNEASLRIVNQGCLGLRGLANRHVKGKLELELLCRFICSTW